MPLLDRTDHYLIPKEPNSTGIADARTFNAAMDYLDDLIFRGTFSPYWKPPVDTFGDLPITDPEASARIVKADARIYIWNGSAWVPSNEGALTYMGTWDASTNTPTLADATGTKGHYYVVAVGGTQDLGSGPISFSPADWVVHNGSIWQKADHTDVVTSVFGRQGAVVAESGDYTHAQLASVGPDDHHARDHRGTHILGGADAFLATDVLDAIVYRLRESGGPADLLVGSIPDGAGLRRSGTSIVGDAGMAYRCWAVAFGSSTVAGFSSGSASPVIMRIKTFPGTDIFGIPMRACTVAMSSSGGPGFVEIYRPSNGTIIATIGPITATTPTVYQFTLPWTNPWPTTEEPIELRVYRGGTATTMTIYDVTAGIY